MREIKFRAKNIRYNEMVYGYLFKQNEVFYIKVITEFSDCLYEVKEETIGQFTGLYDKNKVPIYEGDILNFDDEYWAISFEYGKFIATFDNVCEDLHEVSHYEVIGNIHENSNLIGDVNGN